MPQLTESKIGKCETMALSGKKNPKPKPSKSGVLLPIDNK